MAGRSLRVLISGASVAGPTAAYWLCTARIRGDGCRADAAGPGADQWAGRGPVRAGDGCGRVDRRASRGERARRRWMRPKPGRLGVDLARGARWGLLNASA